MRLTSGGSNDLGTPTKFWRGPLQNIICILILHLVLFIIYRILYSSSQKRIRILSGKLLYLKFRVMIEEITKIIEIMRLQKLHSCVIVIKYKSPLNS